MTHPFRSNAFQPLCTTHDDAACVLAPPAAAARGRARAAGRFAGRIIALGLAIATIAATACTPGQREGARTALDLAQSACVIANALLPDAQVAEVCSITNDLVGPMRTILASTRDQTTKAASSARAAALEERTAGCPQLKGDAGAPGR